MDYLQTISLALIQGLTEFLPISSSAHLILPFKLLSWPDQGLAFDTAVHLGSLLAVLWYFKVDLVSLAQAALRHAGGESSQESRFAINLLIASLPIIPIGFVLKDVVENELRAVNIIILTTVLFAIALLVADKVGRRKKAELELNWRDALLIGLFQCLALVPGTSRSGITMTLGLALGYTRESSSRISFLLSIPAIAGASALKAFDLLESSGPVDWMGLLIGVLVSFISAFVCIRLFLDFIARIGFTPFVIYRLILGALLFWLVT